MIWIWNLLCNDLEFGPNNRIGHNKDLGSAFPKTVQVSGLGLRILAQISLVEQNCGSKWEPGKCTCDLPYKNDAHLLYENNDHRVKICTEFRVLGFEKVEKEQRRRVKKRGRRSRLTWNWSENCFLVLIYKSFYLLSLWNEAVRSIRRWNSYVRPFTSRLWCLRNEKKQKYTTWARFGVFLVKHRSRYERLTRKWVACTFSPVEGFVYHVYAESTCYKVNNFFYLHMIVAEKAIYIYTHTPTIYALNRTDGDSKQGQFICLDIQKGKVQGMQVFHRIRGLIEASLNIIENYAKWTLA